MIQTNFHYVKFSKSEDLYRSSSWIKAASVQIIHTVVSAKYQILKKIVVLLTTLARLTSWKLKIGVRKQKDKAKIHIAH